MKWKCKQSGNIVEFFADHDNEIMEGHDGYEKVEEVKQPEPEAQTKIVKKKTTE